MDVSLRTALSQRNCVVRDSGANDCQGFRRHADHRGGARAACERNERRAWQWRVPAAFLKGIPAQSVTLPKHPYFPSDAPDIAFHRPENDFLEPFTDVVSCGGVSLMAPNATFPSHCVKAWRRAYHAGVSFMDAQVGIVIDALSAIPGGESDRTLVVFFGDHGWQLGEWAEWEKFTNFELAARVPLIFRAPWLSHPEVSGGSVTNTLVELVDVMPTLIELALGGTEKVPTGCEGVSLAPYFNTTHTQRRRIVGKTAVLSQFPRCCTPGAPLCKSHDCDDVPRSKVWKLRYLLTTQHICLLTLIKSNCIRIKSTYSY